MAKKDLKTTEAQRRAALKYQQKFVHVSINMDREFRQKVAEYCERHNTSLSAIVNEHIAELIAKDEAVSENSAK